MSDNKDKPKFHPLGSFNKKPKNSKSEPKNNAQFYKTEERCSESNVIERSIRNSDASIIEAENSFANLIQVNSGISNRGQETSNMHSQNFNHNELSEDESSFKAEPVSFLHEIFCKKTFLLFFLPNKHFFFGIYLEFFCKMFLENYCKTKNDSLRTNDQLRWR